MNLDSLQKLWVHELKDLYSAETQITVALPKIIAATANDDLKAALSSHLEETKGHLTRLDMILKGQNVAPGGQHCKGMEGLLAEGAGMLEAKAEAAVRDAGIISACQRVEHYEIAGYGTASAYAELLGEREAANLLQLTLDEESSADTKLSRLARTSINLEAMATV